MKKIGKRTMRNFDAKYASKSVGNLIHLYFTEIQVLLKRDNMTITQQDIGSKFSTVTATKTRK